MKNLFKTKKYKDELKEMYLAGFTIDELAEHYGFSTCGIRYQLKKLGILKYTNKRNIEKIDTITTIDPKEIIKEYNNKVPVRDIIKKYNLSLNTFKDIFKKHLNDRNLPIKEIKEVIEPTITITDKPMFDIPLKIVENKEIKSKDVISDILTMIGNNITKFSVLDISRKENGVVTIIIKEK